MNLYDYLKLNFDEQAIEWSGSGKFLVSRFDGIYAVNLYALHGFYVESYYNTHTNSIDRLRSFRSTSQLEPYLHSISIEKMSGVGQQKTPTLGRGLSEGVIPSDPIPD